MVLTDIPTSDLFSDDAPTPFSDTDDNINPPLSGHHLSSPATAVSRQSGPLYNSEHFLLMSSPARSRTGFSEDFGVDSLEDDILEDNELLDILDNDERPVPMTEIENEKDEATLMFETGIADPTGDEMPGLSRSTRTESDVASVNQKKEREMLVKQAWVKKMRLQFCVREEFEVTKDIILEDGTLNQEYFRPPRGTTLQDQASTKKWTESDRALLIQGITKHGIGHFRAISEELLPDWRPNDLRIKTMRLIGRQNLQAYKDWKGDETEIAKEYERNKELGLRFDCWKAGVLVADDDGNVERITFNGWFDKSSADENAAVEADKENTAVHADSKLGKRRRR